MEVKEADVYAIDGSVAGKMTLPGTFSKEFRKDIVLRAILSEQSAIYQPQGHSVMAGFNTTAIYVGKYSGYRRGRHMGIAIRPRQKLGGGAMGDVRRIPSSVKGHRAHPHKIEKRITEQMNRREYILAIESAIGASTNTEAISQKHVIEKRGTPFIVEDKIEQVNKTKDLIKILGALGISKDMERSHKPHLRKGAARKSSKRHFRNSVLIVAKNAHNITKAGRNIAGVDVCSINSLTVSKLSPGALPRLMLWSKSAVEGVEQELKKQEVSK
ncbi:MAG: 50S ribosomal protein L4 [Candidatus Marsarchaeota archaeon]|jgi:large subunit ribosomal protein L4e|nr:50S ribosomal protein L4 [Candidatus Marsarchaeota archaeon]